MILRFRPKEGASTDIYIPLLFGQVLLFWYQDFSGAVDKFRYSSAVRKKWWTKLARHKVFPLMYYTRGGSRHLLFKIRPQWSEI
jgi:hypothetical protein